MYIFDRDFCSGNPYCSIESKVNQDIAGGKLEGTRKVIPNRLLVIGEGFVLLIRLRSRMTKAKQKGFTLLELIIVMAILAILAGIAIPKFSDILSSSKKKAHNANVKMIQNAVELYSINTDTALEDIDDIEDLVDNKYLKEVPTNPMEGAEYTVTDGKVAPEAEEED